MMRTNRFIAFLGVSLYSFISVAQSTAPSISEMRWGRDYNLHVKLSNDSNYVMDVRALHHTGDLSFNPDEESTTYYPVNLDEEFVNFIKNRKLEADSLSGLDTIPLQKPKTLWSALHGTLGGGYVHFVNCLVYALESQHLSLSDPIMKRPASNWKPKPMTQTYKRTRKWEHYIPNNQKLAKREYKLRKKENELKDLQGIPTRFLVTFKKTSQKQYDQLRVDGRKTQVAQIDLIRLLLGSKYLGIDQIEYIQKRVTSSVLLYSLSNLPSVIIFDDYRAAVAMTLDKTGYKIDYIVFQDQNNISNEEYNQRFDKIEAFIKAINEANEEVFRKRLSTYYGS
jgi:hypothetical protein